MTDRTEGDEADPLALQAMLYAAGELDGLAAAAFEAQLGSDPAAQEALIQAVTLHELLAGPPHQPNRAYRAEVRKRVLTPRGWWTRLAGRRIYPGHPAAWGLLGAAAAALLFVISWPATPEPLVTDPAALPVSEVAAVPTPPAVDPIDESAVATAVPAVEGEGDEAADNTAELWADLTNMDHLQRAHDEHVRRRIRSVERPGSALNPLQRARPLHNMGAPRR